MYHLHPQICLLCPTIRLVRLCPMCRSDGFNEAMIVTADKEVATGHVSKDKLAQTIIECIAEDLAKEV